MNYHEMEMRAVYAKTLNDSMDENPRVICLEADLGKSSGTVPEVRERHPDNFVECGVCEANMIGIAAGLAREGKIPFCASFTSFASRRAYDQVSISVAFANNNVKIVGTAPGITNGPNGGTHICFQDLAIMRAMPNMHVFSPCDVYELRSVLNYMVQEKHPTYMQLIRLKAGRIFDENYRFNPEKAVILQEGSDVTLVSTGYMTQFAYKVARELSSSGIGVDLLHYPSVKPFDAETLMKSAKKTGAVVTVENQNIIGGLGGAVCEALSEGYPTKVKRLGIADRFGEVASEQYFFEKYGFGPEHIAHACRDMAKS
ncbi:MAG: transketolase family protein [Desulfobacteraceae bacterium]|nr:MAG: transketolase family protein [Desulfobacteraceae bacterium]